MADALGETWGLAHGHLPIAARNSNGGQRQIPMVFLLNPKRVPSRNDTLTCNHGFLSEPYHVWVRRYAPNKVGVWGETRKASEMRPHSPMTLAVHVGSGLVVFLLGDGLLFQRGIPGPSN